MILPDATQDFDAVNAWQQSIKNDRVKATMVSQVQQGLFTALSQDCLMTKPPEADRYMLCNMCIIFND